MFDLRTALLTELNTLDISGIDIYKDMEATELALSDTERIVFNSGAVAIGDWEMEREPLFHNTNKVYNYVDLVLMAKSATAFDDIDRMASDLALELNHNRLANPSRVITSIIDVAGETIKLKPHFYYKILTLTITAYENVTVTCEDCLEGNTLVVPYGFFYWRRGNCY